jgi:hypothetical protein
MGDALRQWALGMAGEIAVEIGLVDRHQALQGIKTEGVHGGKELDLKLVSCALVDRACWPMWRICSHNGR